MAEICCDMNTVKAAVLGGCFLGGGGGGPKEQGIALGELALEIGQPRIIDISSLDEDGKLLTVALVGSPASPDSFVKPADYSRTVDLITNDLDDPIVGLITNENGAVATVNGWYQSVVTGIPVVDAPCNGRAHPTGQMGSMGLDCLEDYMSIQAFAGGGRTHPYTEGIVRSTVTAASSIVRRAAIVAGGFVAVARNPIEASYVKQNGAPGAIRQAIQVGHIILDNLSSGGEKVAEACAEYLGGEICFIGEVSKVRLDKDGGFDVGEVVVKNQKNQVRLTFWNEYMTADRGVSNPERVATFPDLITTLDCESGMPLTTAEIRRGQKVVVLLVPKCRLILSSTMKRKDLLEQVESIVKENIVDSMFDD
jgi:DUF917 family protein